MSKMKTIQRITAIMLSIITVINITPHSVSAQVGELPTSTNIDIISFEELDTNIAIQNVPIGTLEADLKLPETLTASVRLTSEDDMLENSGESLSELEAEKDETDIIAKSDETISNAESDGIISEEDNKESLSDEDTEVNTNVEVVIHPSGTEVVESTSDDPAKITVSLPVTWTSTPAYKEDTEGEYIFTTVPADGYSLAEGALLPKITVTVVRGIVLVKAFDELTDDIRWQNTVSPILPETVSATVEGSKSDQIPVTWQGDQDYDEDSPKRGLYVFTAVIGKEYTIAEGLEIPRITVYIPITEGFHTMARMAGTGTSVSPLEISTADQLAEIATLVNEGRLESFLFNVSSTQVFLELKNNIDLTVYARGKGWTPIGTKTKQFKGNFNGNGKIINGLVINRPEEDYIGLFGSISYKSEVKNLGIENAVMSGHNYVGGLVGYVSFGGAVKNTYTTGKVEGTSYVGGVVGYNIDGYVNKSYSTCIVKGTSLVGGIAGASNGMISDRQVFNCVALNPSVTSGNSKVGRVMGESTINTSLSGNIAFNNMMVNGSTISGYIYDNLNGLNRTAEDIASENFFQSLFSYDPVWTYETGKLPGFGTARPMPEYIHTDSDDPFPKSYDAFVISTDYQLAKLASLVNSGQSFEGETFVLGDDIDLSNYGRNVNNGEGWIPIGNSPTTPFKGVFRGGHSREGR